MAITINSQSKDFTEVEQYLMTLDRGIQFQPQSFVYWGL